MTSVALDPLARDRFPDSVECRCSDCDCPNLAEGTDLCLACKNGVCPEDLDA